MNQTVRGRTSPHLYDSAMRRLVESHLSRVAAWLDPALANVADEQFVRRSTAFTVPVLHADLLAEAGPDRLLHVEYETEPRASLAGRMFRYRARIMDQFPDRHLSQYVIVLGDGTVRGHDDLRANGFAVQLHVVYLRDQDPAHFLSDAVLAPLAVLARGSPKERAANLSRAFRVISTHHELDSSTLVQIAESLAAIRLPLDTIDQIRKETMMTLQPFVDFYRDTDVGHELQAIGEQRGRAEGKAEGRTEGRIRMLLALLRTRFGDEPRCQEAAARLAEHADDEAVMAITSATELEDLLT
jgi:predicted transposase YdaD